MTNKQLLKYLIEQEVGKYLTRRYLKEEEGESSGMPTPVRSFEEDPINYLLATYPSLKETLVLLLTKAFKDYITGIYIIAPKPTTFKIVLHNGQSFSLTYLGRAYEAKVLAKRYYLLTIGDKERAIKAIAGLLELGQPIGTEGPGAPVTAAPAAEEQPAQPEAAPEGGAEEEKTES